MKHTRTILGIMLAVLMLTASYAAAAMHTGTVVEAITGGGYTYMNIDEDGRRFWIAGPRTSIGVGERVTFSEQLWMVNFESKALGRTFDRLLFVSGVEKAQAGTAREAPPVATGPAEVVTVEELYDRKYNLEGSIVEIRGEVVKVSEKIMGMNWVHIKDGTGSRGTDKIIFRSRDNKAPVGSTVTARGRVEIDKDFGFGYYYSVIVEDSTFTEVPAAATE